MGMPLYRAIRGRAEITTSHLSMVIMLAELQGAFLAGVFVSIERD